MNQDINAPTTTTQTRTSTTLLARVATTGDEPACTAFVERYTPLVRTVAFSAGLSAEDCDDVVQEVMIGAIDALRSHRYDREIGRFKSWLKGVVYHKVLDARSAHARQAAGGKQTLEHLGRGSPPARSILRAKTALADMADPAPTPDAHFEATFEAEWQKAAMEVALDEIRHEIDPLTYQAFDLYARKNRPPREIARLLGISRNSVYLAKSRIVARLREKLNDEPSL